MRRHHYTGEINWRRYDIMATAQTAPGVMFARAMAEGAALATNDQKTNVLSSGVTHVTWPEPRRAS